MLKENMLTRKAECYLEAIFSITEEKVYARIRDITSALGISAPSAVEMVKKLDDMDFVIYRKYDGVVLTPKGEAIVYELNSKKKIRKVLSKRFVDEKI
nr:hypothetical protein, containing iron dependent repressor, N-terminal DNA binding domain [uncultured archaeon]